MIIDDISAVSLHGGVVRIQGTSMNADGQMVNTVILEIPATNIGMIIDKLASGVNQLGEKVQEAQENAKSEESNGSSKSKKSSKTKKKDDDEIEIID